MRQYNNATATAAGAAATRARAIIKAGNAGTSISGLGLESYRKKKGKRGKILRRIEKTRATIGPTYLSACLKVYMHARMRYEMYKRIRLCSIGGIQRERRNPKRTDQI